MPVSWNEKFKVIGFGSKPYIRNVNPKELPHGDNGIGHEHDMREKDFDDLDDAESYLSHLAVSYGEEGGSFHGIILRIYEHPDTGEVQQYHIVDHEQPLSKADYRTAWKWAKIQLEADGE